MAYYAVYNEYTQNWLAEHPSKPGQFYQSHRMKNAAVFDDADEAFSHAVSKDQTVYEVEVFDEPA